MTTLTESDVEQLALEWLEGLETRMETPILPKSSFS